MYNEINIASLRLDPGEYQEGIETFDKTIES